MITELTAEQEALKEDFRKKGIEMGTDTTPVSNEVIETSIEFLYKFILKKELPKVEITSSPQAAWDAVRKHVNNPDMEYIHPYLDGHLFAYFFAYYDYMKDVLDVKYDVMDAYKAFANILNTGNIYPLDDICIVSRKPTEIHFINDNYHNENGPAVAYEDGFSLYFLNGVNVPEWLVMTPVEELDMKEFANIKNVEVRREFLRKVNIENFVAELAPEVLDTQDEYTLYLIDLGGDTGKWPYLKMKNPSLVDTWHVEAVDVSCKTVEDALAFRNKSKLKPSQLT